MSANFFFQKFVDSAQQCFALQLKLTLPPIIWISTDGEGDKIGYLIKSVLLYQSGFFDGLFLTYVCRWKKPCWLEMVFWFKNCFVVLWKKMLWLRKTFEIWGWRLKSCKNFAVTRTIYWNKQLSEQFLKQNAFLTCSEWFLRSNTFRQL